MTNPTPYWHSPAWRKRHGFDSIQGPTWKQPFMIELRGTTLARYRRMLGVE